MKRAVVPSLLLAILMLALAGCRGDKSAAPTRAVIPSPVPAATRAHKPGPVDAMVKAGWDRVEAGDLKGAETMFRDALALDRRSGRAYAALSRLHLDLREHDQEALAEAREAVRLSPEDADAWAALSIALVRGLRGEEAVEAGRKAAALDDGDAAALAALAHALLFQREDAEALETAREAVKADGQSPEAHLALSNAYETTGDFARAEAAVRKAAALQPLNFTYRTRLAELLARRLEYGEAATILAAVADQSGQAYVPATRAQAEIAMARGDLVRATERIARWLELAPGSVEARLARGELEWRGGKPDAAEAVYREVLKAAPEDFSARLELANLALQRGECATAGNAFGSLAVEQPRLARPLIGQAMAAECAANERRATELLEKAIDLEPCNPEALAHLGSLYLQQERRNEAQKMYGRSWGCSAAGANMQAEVGATALALGDVDAALDAFRLAAEIDPANSAAMMGLCWASMRAGDKEAALSTCEAAGKRSETAPEAKLGLAMALIANGQAPSAVAMLRPLEAVLGDGSTYHHLLGIAYMNMGDYPAARNEYEALGKTTGTVDPRLGTVLGALESGWVLDDEAAQERLGADLGTMVSRPVTVTIESGPGGRKLALQLASRTGDAPERVLHDATTAMLKAGRYAARIRPAASGGIDVQVLDAAGKPLYGLQASLTDARRLASLQLTDDEFIQALHLVEADQAGPFAAGDVQAIGERVAALRGFPTAADVPLARLTRQEYAQQLELAGAASQLERKDAGALESLLGLIEPDADLTSLEIDLSTSIMAGYYNHDAKSFALIGQAAGSWQDRLTIAHEYAHAIQDREFDTAYLLDSAASEDMSVALRAVVEGDAEVLEAAYLKEQVPLDAELFYYWTTVDLLESEAAIIPPFMTASSAFPYEAGLDFVQDAYGTGGWASVNELFRNPPVSTEQILHPELYRSGHLPVAVALPALAKKLGGEWGVVETGTMGELGWRVVLAPFTGEMPAAAAAQGWGGDRFALLRQGAGGEYAAAFQTAWDDEAEAEEFAGIAGTWLDRRTGGGQVAPDLLLDAPDRHWVQGRVHWLMRQRGERVTIVVAPGADLADELIGSEYPHSYQCVDDTPATGGGSEAVLGKLSEIIEARPNVDALRQRAVVYLEQGDQAAAIADLDRAITLDGNRAYLWMDRGRVRHLDGNYSAVIADMTRALELQPGAYMGLMYRGLAYAAQGEYAGAIQDYTEGLRNYPGDAFLLGYRGDAYWGQEDRKRALADYTAAAIQLPDFADLECEKAWLFNSQGHLLQEQGEYLKAIAAFGAGLKLRPDDAGAWYDRGSVYLEWGDNDRALADFSRVVELDPDSAEARRQRAYIYLLKNDFAAALADLDEAIKLAPDSAEGYHARGYAYLLRGFRESDAGRAIRATGDFARAISDLNVAIEIAPDLSDAYYRRGQAYHARGDRESAIADYSRAIELAPDDADPYWNRGYAHAEQGEKGLAISDFERYIELSDDEEARAEIRKELEILRAGE